jgi:hypothetical protein
MRRWLVGAAAVVFASTAVHSEETIGNRWKALCSSIGGDSITLLCNQNEVYKIEKALGGQYSASWVLSSGTEFVPLEPIEVTDVAVVLRGLSNNPATAFMEPAARELASGNFVDDLKKRGIFSVGIDDLSFKPTTDQAPLEITINLLTGVMTTKFVSEIPYEVRVRDGIAAPDDLRADTVKVSGSFLSYVNFTCRLI